MRGAFDQFPWRPQTSATLSGWRRRRSISSRSSLLHTDIPEIKPTGEIRHRNCRLLLIPHCWSKGQVWRRRHLKVCCCVYQRLRHVSIKIPRSRTSAIIIGLLLWKSCFNDHNRNVILKEKLRLLLLTPPQLTVAALILILVQNWGQDQDHDEDQLIHTIGCEHFYLKLN